MDLYLSSTGSSSRAQTSSREGPSSPLMYMSMLVWDYKRDVQHESQISDP